MVTSARDEPQKTVLGEVERARFVGLLFLGIKSTRPAFGLQDTDSDAVADPVEAEKVRVSGLVVHVALGVTVDVGARLIEA